MDQVGIRRAIVGNLVQRTREEAASRRRNVETIDPIMRIGRKMYPYLSDRELVDYASTALRVILLNGETDPHQTTLMAY